MDPQDTPCKILTIYDDPQHILKTPANLIPLTPSGLERARQIGHLLRITLKPLMPALGLAANQIGILEQIFIFTYDRTWETITTVLNPQLLSVKPEQETAWEGCFSGRQEQGEFQIARLARPQTIEVRYHTLEGEQIEQTLTGLPARVFLHEYDHLNGMVNVWLPQAHVEKFPNETAMKAFLMDQKKNETKA